MVGFIPEVLTLFWHSYWHIYACQMPYVMYVVYAIYVINDTYDILCHTTYDICMYVNMGVNRSVRTSGMKPTILNILQNCFPGRKLKYPVFQFFLCICQNFLCIVLRFCASTSRQLMNKLVFFSDLCMYNLLLSRKAKFSNDK